MKLRRDIDSIPARTAEDTWAVITKLVTGPDSVDANQFNQAATVMESLITDECFKVHPLTLAGVKHRVVIYLKHGFDALEGKAVDPLPSNPTAGDWTLYVPCPEEEFEWTKKTLTGRAPRFVVIKQGDKLDDSDTASSTKQTNPLTVNWGALTQ